MSFDELQKAYNHTLDMLYRKTNYKFGKLEVRKNIQKLHRSCNAELLHRYLQHDLAIERQIRIFLILLTNLRNLTMSETTLL